MDGERNHPTWKGGRLDSSSSSSQSRNRKKRRGDGVGEAKEMVDDTESLQRLVHRAEHTLKTLVDSSLHPEATALLLREGDVHRSLQSQRTRVDVALPHGGLTTLAATHGAAGRGGDRDRLLAEQSEYWREAATCAALRSDLHELREEHEIAMLRAAAGTEMREATSERRVEHLGRVVDEARTAEISAATLRANCARAERDATRRGALLNDARAASDAAGELMVVSIVCTVPCFFASPSHILTL